MSIRLKYTEDIEKFKDACDRANSILKSEKFFKMIASRQTPYSESVPRDLAPKKIAEFFRDSNLVLTLQHYQRPESIGGAFRWRHPNKLFVNTNTNRTGCVYAAVLIHECVHALSYHTKGFDFTHDEDSSRKNRKTAPYAIQKSTRETFCDEKQLTDDDLIVVELETMELETMEETA